MQLLKDSFQTETVLLDVPAHDLPTLFRVAVERLVEIGRVEESRAADVQTALMRREAGASTAIGHAVAVPHVYLDAIKSPTVLFIRLEHAINLGAPDGVPTQFLFFLLGPPDSTAMHLDTLASTARLMADDEFRYEAGKAESSKELVAALDAFVERTSPAAVEEPGGPPEGLAWTGKLMGGIRQDIARKLPFYRQDFLDGLHPKCVGSTVFLFFACLAPAITFGGLMAKSTGGQIGAVEMLLATAVCGVVCALFSGQPLTILGGTGPLLVFTVMLYGLCQDWGVEFLPMYAWVGLWSALFILLLAVFDASCLMRYFTRFTDEIFSALISLIFIYEAVHSLAGYFHGIEEEGNHDQALLSLILGLGTFYVATSLSRFRRSSYLLPWMREFLADFGPSIALVSMAAVAVFWLDEVSIEGLKAPAAFGPTLQDRPWLINLWSTPWDLRWKAAGPALLVAVLVYLDQNITARLVNSPDHKLQRGPGYHLDLAVVGLLLAFCSLLGLPWLVAATVRSLNHVRSLASFEEASRGGETHERIIHVRENRITSLAIHLLIGCSLLLLPWLAKIPLAVLYGVFLFMGVVSISGNQFFERLSLWVKDPDLYPTTHYIRRAPIWTIHLFTGIQFMCLGVLWFVKTNDNKAIAILFPLFIAMLVPVRFALDRFFDKKHLAALDAEEEPEDEETHWA